MVNFQIQTQPYIPNEQLGTNARSSGQQIAQSQQSIDSQRQQDFQSAIKFPLDVAQGFQKIALNGLNQQIGQEKLEAAQRDNRLDQVNEAYILGNEDLQAQKAWKDYTGMTPLQQIYKERAENENRVVANIQNASAQGDYASAYQMATSPEGMSAIGRTPYGKPLTMELAQKAGPDYVQHAEGLFYRQEAGDKLKTLDEAHNKFLSDLQAGKGYSSAGIGALLNRLPTDENGQPSFNVKMKADMSELTLPSGEKLPLKDYLGSFKGDDPDKQKNELSDIFSQGMRQEQLRQKQQQIVDPNFKPTFSAGYYTDVDVPVSDSKPVTSTAQTLFGIQNKEPAQQFGNGNLPDPVIRVNSAVFTPVSTPGVNNQQTPTVTDTQTATPTFTPSVVPPTNTPISTATSTQTSTPIQTQPDTFVPAVSQAPTIQSTNTPTQTNTPTATPSLDNTDKQGRNYIGTKIKIGDTSLRIVTAIPLIDSMINSESSGNANAESHDKYGKPIAHGLLQLIPSTAADMAKVLGIPKPDEEKLKSDPQLNVDLGVKYMEGLTKRYNGQEEYALAAYNWGLGNVDDQIKKLQDEGKPVTFINMIKGQPLTKAEIERGEKLPQTYYYVKNILANKKLIERKAQGLEPNPLLSSKAFQNDRSK